MALPPTLAGGYQLWYYYPSVPASIIVAIIFGILSVAHIGGIFKTGKKFCLPLAVGGLFEVIGYVFRVVAHYKIASTTPYAVQSLLILLAPILFAASVYMCLGRIITGTHGEHYSVIRPRRLTAVFVTGDVICFLVQAGGGGLLATAKSASATNLGQHVILGGLILQIVIFFFFVLVAITFHTRMTAARIRQTALPWQRLLFSLYAISSLIMLRNIIRTVEYASPPDGYMLRHEWVIFVFDGACMILVLLISLFWYTTELGSRRKPVLSGEETYHMVNKQ